MKAVILAGGFGKRLKPLTDNRPKPMIEILDKPIIEWQIRYLAKKNI
ncbi:MAG: nucleotidyltransferase family protein [Candidatus Nitrosocosmicus sp.]